MAAYRRVYDTRHLQVDCHEPVIEYGLLFKKKFGANTEDVNFMTISTLSHGFGTRPI